MSSLFVLGRLTASCLIAKTTLTAPADAVIVQILKVEKYIIASRILQGMLFKYIKTLWLSLALYIRVLNL